ncbi:MAG: PIN domain-containing protein [Candidatus Methanodesulfokora sp.]
MRKVLIDTYAIMAAATSSLTPVSEDVLLKVRRGAVRGVIHGLILYEVIYHWHRGRLPGFKSEEEITSYLLGTFLNIRLTNDLMREAAKVKVKGDDLLKLAEDKALQGRKLSSCDAITISIGIKYSFPVVSGDRDLQYVAKKLGVEVLW